MSKNHTQLQPQTAGSLRSPASTPKLRFPGFDGVWEEKKFGDIYDFLKTNSFSRAELSEDGQVINIHYGDIHKSDKFHFDIQKEKLSYLKADNVKTDFIQDGDVVIADASEDRFDVGKSVEVLNIKNKKVVSGLHTFLARPKNIALGFSGFLLRTSNLKRNFYRIATGASVLGISKTEVSKIKINLPKILEQQKIASFLGSVDEWVLNLRAQHAELAQYKKGMMQKIFSQKIRFKDDKGNDFPEWEEKKLGEIFKERKEYSIKGEGFPHISLTTEGVVPKSERYNRDFLVGDDEIKKYKVTRTNDLCYNPANLKFGVISINKLGDGIFSPIYVTFEVIKQDINFIGYYLIRDEFIAKARRYEQGTVYERMAVHPDDFLRLRLLIPPLPEQQKIAEFLSSVDQLLESKQQQITEAENWKKGVMQGLFV